MIILSSSQAEVRNGQKKARNFHFIRKAEGAVSIQRRESKQIQR
jgi:hypothetical protein